MKLKFERLAFDSNAAIDLLRPDRPSPEPLLLANTVVLPCFVWAELEVGLSRAPHRSQIEVQLQELIRRSVVLFPDAATIKSYVLVRQILRAINPSPNPERREALLHDFWIAALCLQHDLPLLSNDGGFDHIEGLHVIHW
jgi:tRNA(fMet)-specific endonuclease VapC